MKIYIVYDSEVGHTEKLARSIAKGAKSIEGTEVFINHVNNANIRDLVQMDAIIWGCPGHFGTISSGLKAWIDKLGFLWAEGNLVDKIGSVFCTTATVHGGIEATLLNLITPMLHQGMMVVGLPANIPENAFYGSYYGIGVTSPDEDTDDELTHSLYEKGISLGESLGKRVAYMTKIFLTGKEYLSSN
ncbi:NAD(P)H-dependent oxidoreductase [Paenibacillus aceris]|uniref:NAD(P)H dehydrogenase (Quinone) n=1 Tax=Paenibacillus aceris TaxID=869555 RepID=A0ABS4I429_9BACL|nr:NAD(P)H-dependent oxidoreductase [Paenibacillus aceris]MBP1965654.1 NAD(P)H dehydrogenase (quinone) [Paenibacillus aceris]NHW36368.1 flavodoxin family protein [Paenibacillus aceris]